jgi:hypothetical protein
MLVLLLHSLHTEVYVTLGVMIAGGWFIPEVWMRPSFFRDTGLGWGGSLCALVSEGGVGVRGGKEGNDVTIAIIHTCIDGGGCDVYTVPAAVL